MTAVESLGRRAIGGAAYVGTSQAIRIVMTMLSTIVVARILSPSDYGVIAMAAPVTSLVLIFQNLGLNEAVVQSEKITSEQTNALFWINVLASTVLAVLVVLASPFVGMFYQDARAAYIVAASAATIILSSFALQHSALLNRHMRFRAIAAIDVVNSISTFVITTILAILLGNYWALWIGMFLGAAINVVLLWSRESWRPNFQISLRGSGEMIRFGAGLTGYNLTNFLSRNVDNVLIAKVWGAAALGLYDRAYKLMLFPLQNISSPLSRIMLPVLSKLRGSPSRYRRAFLLAIGSVQLAAVPGIAVAVATANDLVPFLLGPRWSATGPIFFWLGLNGILQMMANATGWLFISSGRSATMMSYGIIAAFFNIAAILIGLIDGPTGVARAYFVAALVRAPILYAMATRGTSVSAKDLYAMMAPFLVASAGTWAVAHLMLGYLDIVPRLLVAIPVSYALALIVAASNASCRELYAITFRKIKRTMPLRARGGLRL